MSTKKDVLDHVSNSLLFEVASNFNDDTVVINEERIESLKRTPSGQHIAKAARDIVEKYENTILADKVKEVVVKDVRAELLRNTMWGKALDAALIVMTIILAVAFVAIPTVIFSDDPEAAIGFLKDHLRIYCYSISGLFFLNLVLLMWAKFKS